MYILELNQEGEAIELGLFDSLEEGRAFISKLDGYKLQEEDGFIYESISLDRIPDYLELEYKGNIVPLTRFMFVNEGDIDIIWRELPILSNEGAGLVKGATRVDAYVVDNEDVKTYIETREQRYCQVKDYFEERGYEVTRAYFGSEDGEAILYRKNDEDDWHFLDHLDPLFVEEGDIEDYIKGLEI